MCEEYEAMCHVIGGVAVETLLRPPSSISEETCLSCISALNELPVTSKDRSKSCSSHFKALDL